MSTFDWPSHIATPASFDLNLGQASYRASSMFGYKGQSIDLVKERWTAELGVSIREGDTGAELEAFLNRLRKRTNTVWLPHYEKLQPDGTAQYSAGPVVDAFQGDNQITISVGANETLLQGDMLGFDGQLLQVAEDCEADQHGVIVVPLVNRLRRSVDSFSRSSTATFLSNLDVFSIAAVNTVRRQRKENRFPFSEDIGSAYWGVTPSKTITTKTYEGSTFWEITKTTAAMSEAIYSWARPGFNNGDTATFTVALLAGTTDTALVGVLDANNAWGFAGQVTHGILSGPGQLGAVVSVGAITVSNLSADTPTVVRITRTFTATLNARALIYPGTNASVTVGHSVLMARPMMNLGPEPMNYEASGTGLGPLLIEEARTNTTFQSHSLTTTPWSGCQRTLAAELWASAVSFYEVAKLLTVTSESSAANQFAVTAGSTWTMTVALLAGTSTTCSVGLLGTILESGSGNWGSAELCTQEILSGPGTLSVYSVGIGGLYHVDNLHATLPTVVRITRTFVQAMNGQFRVYPGRVASVTPGDSVKVTRVQTEQGAYATSYIPTTTAAVTRAADVVPEVQLQAPKGKFFLTSKAGVTYGRGGIMQAASFTFEEDPR